MSGMTCHAFVGGLPMATDLQNTRNCQIAVGTPGKAAYTLRNSWILTLSLPFYFDNTRQIRCPPGVWRLEGKYYQNAHYG